MKPWLGLILFASSFALSAQAEEQGCCAGCGHHCCLKPVCRLVCEPKTIVEVVYDCQCEDFSTMGPSRKCGEVCEPDCCGHPKTRTLWQPSCGQVRHRHVLIKHEIAKEVHHYKCVVEHVCDRCCCQCGRVPCDEASQLGAAAEEMNAAAQEASAPQAAAPKRPFFWSALFKSHATPVSAVR
jgi:hypothetical protein